MGTIEFESFVTGELTWIRCQEKSSPQANSVLACASLKGAKMTPMLYWVEGPWAGRLAISARPRGGDWLEDEAKGWRESGICFVVSLLTPDEMRAFNLTTVEMRCREQGITFLSFPITDRGVPPTYPEALAFIRSLEKKLAEGENVAVHCRQGLGRSSIIIASLLVVGGLGPNPAIRRVSSARGCPVPETAEQSEWVARLAQDVAHVRVAG